MAGRTVVDVVSPAKAVASPANKGTNGQNVVLDSVDEELYKLEGTVRLKDTGPKHGFGDETIESMPVEAYDERVLKERDIKLMSFHAYLRKLKSQSGGGKFSQLARHDFGSYGEAGGAGGKDVGWGARAVSMSRIPKPMTLTRQKYRHVDRVEFEDPAILNRFLDAWRQTGAMRWGYMYGTYELDSMVPLGIKALVKAIYEPPQENAADGVNMLEDSNADAVDRLAAMLGMTKVGWIFLDLEPVADNPSKYVCSRRADTFFLRSNEAILAAHLQNKHSSPCKECDDGNFGSKFVTVVVTGDDKGELGYVAYQVTQQAMDLEKAEGILEWTSKADHCRVAKDSKERRVPTIFYQAVSERGIQVNHEAKPYFPVDYLTVSVNGPTFPQQPDPTFSIAFPCANRFDSPQGPSAIDKVRAHLAHTDNKPFKPTGQLKCIGDFHFLLCLATQTSVVSLEDLDPLCKAVSARDGLAVAEFTIGPTWGTLLAVLDAGGGANDGGYGGGDSAMADGFGEFGTGEPVRAPAREGVSGSGARGTGSSAGQYTQKVDQLAAMGFDRQRALEILDIVHGNVEMAADMLSQ